MSQVSISSIFGLFSLLALGCGAGAPTSPSTDGGRANRRGRREETGSMRAGFSVRVAGLVTSPAMKGGCAKRRGRREETGSMRTGVLMRVAGLVTSPSANGGLHERLQGRSLRR